MNNLSTILDSLSTIISSISLLVSIFFFIYYLRDRAREQFYLYQEYANQLMDWYFETVKILSLLYHKVHDDDFNIDQPLSVLSALIERGRFFFPNIDKGDSFGIENPIAYRGYRNLALDFLVASYNLYKNEDRLKQLDKAVQLRRHFTSIVFEVVRPKESLESIKKLTDRYYVKEEIFEDYLQNKNTRIIEFLWPGTQ